MEGAAQLKWGCEYCTYKNWDASKKCTICQAPRPMRFITDTIQSPDIYEVASLASNQNEGQTVMQKQNTDSNKWSCDKCTYLNWARAKKCVVCHSLNPATEPVPVLAAALAPLSINTHTPMESCSNSQDTGGQILCSSQDFGNNRCSPGSSTPSGNNKAVVTSSFMKTYQKKWVCKVCTFENWPRSAKCTICAAGRSPSTSPSLSPGTLQSPPPNSPRGAAATVLPNKSGRRSESSANLHRRQERLSELDWLWLKACVGTTEGDRIAVDAYLACGGDVARQLTAEEAKLLGDGLSYQKGHSLLNLALQSQREDVVALLLTASVTSNTKKRLPPHTCPDLANEILRAVACSLRQRKGEFPCFFFTESVTFALPGGNVCLLSLYRCPHILTILLTNCFLIDIVDLLPTVEKQLLSDILDQDVQRGGCIR